MSAASPQHPETNERRGCGSPVAKRAKTLPSILSTGPWAAKQPAPSPDAASVRTVVSPASGEQLAHVQLGGTAEVDAAVRAAHAALPAWRDLTSKRRAAILLKYHALCMDASEELIRLIMAENGKNYAEAAGDLAKGLETVEWACSIPHTHPGRVLQVSSGVTCHEARDPVGVVAAVVPFNFPFMVPMWTVPIALVCGNAVVLKPSEKVPLTMSRAAQLMAQAGVPDGVLQLIQGTQEAVEALCDHPRIGALTFVGSSRVAELVYERAKRTGKKALALGGAKNHLVAAPDCDVDMAATDIVASFAGCAGQRCMAASVLLTIGAQPKLVDAVVAKATQLRPGQAKGCMGPVIDAAAVERIVRIVDDAERSGAKVLLDGRKWREEAPSGGHWVGPTVLEMPRQLRDHAAMRTEIFGPVLCVHPVADAEEALEIENGDPHGNAAAIYTSSGATADWFTRRFGAAMVGVNIGVPVPREPFSFGGMEGSLSKFGEHDITGDGGVNFFTRLRKVTTKWTTTPNAAPDAANFGGVM